VRRATSEIERVKMKMGSEMTAAASYAKKSLLTAATLAATLCFFPASPAMAQTNSRAQAKLKATPSLQKNSGSRSNIVVTALPVSIKRSPSSYTPVPAPATKRVASQSLSIPLFFEPNQGQTDPQVKFLSRGSGYGLFLTSDEAVLELHRSAKRDQTAHPPSDSVIRMHLDGASASATVSGASPLPGKSNYFIGNDSLKWRQNIPQFARVEYQAVYPGVDLIYYGNQGQLEYDFRVAPQADPSKIALTFDGATTKIDAGDLVLSTPNGEVRFHAPRVYQPANERATEQASATQGEKTVVGSFRQLADNRIGFAIGDYDHTRELVIDPILSYATYLGGSGAESNVQVAIDAGGLIYVAGSTTSVDFPTSAANSPNNLAFQPSIAGPQNVFIAVINPTRVPPAYGDNQQLVYATYLGGNGVDLPAGVAVDKAFSIYVAGTTTSSNFPFTLNAFQKTPEETGTHGFLTKIAFGANGAPTNQYALSYSSYLSGNGTDHITGLAIDSTQQNAYVTGDTTSSDPASNGFPANPNGYQIVSNSPGNSQFFATEVNTSGSGFNSILYSTYFGGGNPVGATATGGGIAVDPTSSSVNMYITGTTNMLPTTGPNGEPAFTTLNAQQACLNGPGKVSNCPPPGTNTDAIAVKFNPNVPSTSSLIYSTYVGGSGTDAGLAIAVDSSSDAYIGGSTNSDDWSCQCGATGFDTTYTGTGGQPNGFVARINNLANGVYPLYYFTYIGGTGPDSVNAVQVDSLQVVHIAGSTFGGLPLTLDAPYTYSGGGDAFVGAISASLSGNAIGDFLTYIGGSQLDQGTGVAFDSVGATYVVGNTISPNFPLGPTPNPFQGTLNAGSQDAFIGKFSAVSQVGVSNSTSSPSPNPVPAGQQAAFTFLIVNYGPDNASQVNFYATVPQGLGTTASAIIRDGTGSCNPQIQGLTLNCNFPTLPAMNCTPGNACPSAAEVEVDVTALASQNLPTLSVIGAVAANGGAVGLPSNQTDQVVDFKIIASSPNPNPINAGDSAAITVQFCPLEPQLGYPGSITPTQTTTPSMVTASTPVFTPTPVTMGGSGCGQTTLSIATVARPVNTGSLLHRGPIYATWLPIGGLSLLGLGIGAGASKKRRRWLAGALFGGILGVIMLQLACGNSSTSANPTGGTLAGTYYITISGSAGTGSSHNQQVQLVVH